jgi:hypothetical protein
VPAASLWVTSRVRTAVERVDFPDDFGFEKCVVFAFAKTLFFDLLCMVFPFVN